MRTPAQTLAQSVAQSLSQTWRGAAPLVRPSDGGPPDQGQKRAICRAGQGETRYLRKNRAFNRRLKRRPRPRGPVGAPSL